MRNSPMDEGEAVSKVRSLKPLAPLFSFFPLTLAATSCNIEPFRLWTLLNDPLPPYLEQILWFQISSCPRKISL